MADETSPLPPLEWLRVFEAAARLGNFTAAAEELGLTQAAVSQRIRNLEARIGVPLFVRLPRGVEPTVDGESYAPHVRAALLSLQRSTADLFSAPRRRLSIAATSATAELWIAPRLPALLERLPDLQVSLFTIARISDYAGVNADLEVRFGTGDWPGRRAKKMFDELLAPVAAPALLERQDRDWRSLPQIAVSSLRDGWLDWAAAADVAPPRPPSLRFDTFAQGLAAAKSGAGVLLGSLALIEREIAAGQLLRLPEPSIRMEAGYWLTWPTASAPYRERSLVIDALCTVP